MASRMTNISLKYNVIAENLKRARIPNNVVWRGKKEKDPMAIYREGVGSRLPEAYFKWNRIGMQGPAIHWKDNGVDWEKDPLTGDRKRVNRVPIQVHHPPESQFGLWGGEGEIIGYRKSKETKGVRVKKVWKPFITKRKFYSEILDKEFELETTNRVLDLIDDAFGFDFYILKTPAEELHSLVGMIIKRHILLRLTSPEDMYPDDLAKKEKILKKYQKFVIPKEEAEWVGLTPAEAFAKQREIERLANPIRPLKDVYTEELVAKLREQQGDGLYTFSKEDEEKAKPFLQRLLGGSGKDEGTRV
ncbi:large ribosomal subunit protein bL28m-like [Diadema setosum]|uniref:large ribosomal subunit protein bL28m-like n=1 Tax=Diadema setosum TaxID=31175 RepID=UPI003B3BB22B